MSHLRRTLRAVAGGAAVACAVLCAAPAVAAVAAAPARSASAVTHEAHRSYASPRDVWVGGAESVKAKAGRTATGSVNGAIESSNWSGYRVTDGTTGYTAVSATWVEPDVTCNSIAAGAGQYASFWVGLDVQGLDGNVQQDGSTVYCDGTTPVHYIWWEEAPYNAAQSFADVNGGDTITASTVYSAATGDFTLTVEDVTTSRTYTETTGCPAGETCSRAGAEWIAEAPQTDGETDPLFPYGTVTFTDASATDATGHTGVITDASWSYDSYTEQDIASLGTPGAIGGGGNTFSIAGETGVQFSAAVPDITPANDVYAATPAVHVEGDFSVLGLGAANWAPGATALGAVNPNAWGGVVYSTSDVALEYEYNLGGSNTDVQADSSCETGGYQTVDVSGQVVNDTVAHWAGPVDCGSSQVTISLSSSTVPSGAAVYLLGSFSKIGELLPAAPWDWQPALVALAAEHYGTWTITLRGAPGSVFTYTLDTGGWTSLELSSSCGQEANVSVTFPAFGNLTTSSTTAPEWGNTTACPDTDPDYALNQTVTASSNAPGYPAANAVDGNTSTYWESLNNAGYPQTLTVDLGATEGIGKIVLDLPPSSLWTTRTETLSVLGSTDGTTYSTLVSPAGYTFNPSTGNVATITLTRTGVRYLELDFSGNTGWSAAQVSELSAYQS